MTLHYHGLPLTPNASLESIGGAHFCISYARPDQIEMAHRIGQSVMLDNGAFSFWRERVEDRNPSEKARAANGGDWSGYYEFADRWLHHPTTWAVIPDVIEGSEDANDELVAEWPLGDRGAPVWHMHESLDRLCRLDANWPKVCIGSSAGYSELGTECWHRRMEEAFNAVWINGSQSPYLHLLRGMALVNGPYPFASLDSTNVAQNHKRPPENALQMVTRIDAKQCPSVWEPRVRERLELVA